MKYLLLIPAYIGWQQAPAQVAVNNDGSAPHPSAQLEVKATDKGLLLPRVSPAAVANPAEGLLLYNTTNSKLSYRTANGWTNVASASDLYARFQNSTGYQGSVNNTASTYTEYSWIVPAGIVTIWIEAWAGGDSGSPISATATTNNSNSGFSGGDGGDFASFLVDVTAGETITIRVGRGGAGVTSAVGGGPTQIITNAAPIRTYSINQQGRGISYNGATSGATIPGLLLFVGGQDGEFSEISYAQSGPTEYRRIFTGGNGGDSYPNQKGGKGITMTYNAVTGNPLIGSLIIVTGKNGATPGAGGGASIGDAGDGGAGLVIVHW
ncbi:MAG: hypothetical protein ABIN67_22690 [Ferruginibacter sp.]